jgi:mono/diheme cytochrome c family protein
MFLAAVILILFFVAVQATRHWVAVERTRRLKNPVPATPRALAAGEQLYGIHCQKCHGEKGDGRGEKAAELFAKPTDFTNYKQMRPLRDGEIFVAILEGKKPMPAFGDKVSDEQAWQLVDYVRTFARTSVQAP